MQETFEQGLSRDARASQPQPRRPGPRPGPPHRRRLPPVRGQYRAGKSPVIADYLDEIPEVGRLGAAVRTDRPGAGTAPVRTRRSRGPIPGRSPTLPTIAPASPPTAPIPGLANPSVHEEATVAPRDPGHGRPRIVRAGAARCLRTGPCPLFRRLRDHPGSGARRHGRRVPRPASQSQPQSRPQDDPRRPARLRVRGPAVPHRRPRPPRTSIIPISCRFAKSANTRGSIISPWASSMARAWRIGWPPARSRAVRRPRSWPRSPRRSRTRSR